MEGYLFLGGDKRIIYAAEFISQYNSVAGVGLDGLPAPTGKYSKIVLPLPFSRDGTNINAPLSKELLPLELITEYAQRDALILSGGKSDKLQRLCSENSLRLADYFSQEELTLKNALLTAEGAVSLLISGSDCSLFGSSALITGYGRISRYLARLLREFHCRVTIAARNPVQREKAVLDGLCTLPIKLADLAAASADFVINTVPAELFTEESFKKMRSGAVYMELASRASFPEKEWAEAAGITYIAAAGLPGKFSPKTAGEAAANAIISLGG